MYGVTGQIIFSIIILKIAQIKKLRLKDKEQWCNEIYEKVVKDKNFMKSVVTKKYADSSSKMLYIMRGIPGSGKSYLAREIAGESGKVFSADDYHMVDGEYKWSLENVEKAREWNHQRVIDAIDKGDSPVVIDNTHVKKLDMLRLKPIVELAHSRGYKVKIEEPNPQWYHWETAFAPRALFERNKKTHNVPLEAIEKMVSQYDKDVTVEDILYSDN